MRHDDVCLWGNFRWPYHDRLAAQNDRTACELAQGYIGQFLEAYLLGKNNLGEK